MTLTPSTLAVFRDGDRGQVDYLVAFTGSIDIPPRVDVQVDDLPAGVVAQLSPTQPFFTLRAGAGAMTGAFTVRVRARAFFNGALKVHTYPLPLTVVDGYTLAIGVGPGCPSLIANETYVGALVVSDSGELSELYRTGDGACHWVPIGPPMGRRNPRIAVSDPGYVGVAMGYRGGFMNGLDGHVYEASASGGGHDWTWADHGA